MPEWTEDQKKVIAHRGSNLLVAAAAGSGKTAVLVERIISMLTDPEDPVSLDALLVMTFTEAAASEMRERIKLALEQKLMEQPDNAHLIREAGSIQNANINTIDAFCKRLITENYAALDLDPAFRIADQGELRLLQGDVIERLMEARYAEETPAFRRFVDGFSSGKDDRGIDELILQLYNYAQANPWPEEWLEAQRAEFADAADMKEIQGEASAAAAEEAQRMPQETAPWQQWFLSYLKLHAADAAALLGRALSVCEEPDGPEGYRATIFAEYKQLRVLETSASLAEFAEALAAVQFGRLRPSKSEKKEFVTGLRNAVKKEVQKLQAELVLPAETDAVQAEHGIAESMCVLLSLTEEFAQRFAAEKDKRHILDFNDLEHYALRVLYEGEGEVRRPSAIADEYAGQLREILVDEYQDSNYVQEELIRALSAERFGRPDVFQVGDVKQSIYSFRLARPDLFIHKYEDETYPKIELAKNFRSRREVIESINALFFRIMKRSVGGVAYTERTALHPGRTEETAQGARDCATELLLVEADEAQLEALGLAEPPDKEQLEAKLLARRIKKLVAEEGYRYRDIVILMRSPGAWADTVVEVLGAEGIPAYATVNEGYYTAVEVETVLAYLSIIDNPCQDISLAAVMHSPIYGFTDSELAEIKAVKGSLQRILPEAAQEDGEAAVQETQTLSPALAEKYDAFWKALDHFRDMAQYLSIHELLYELYSRTGYYNYVSAMPAGARRRANLDALIDSALNFERTSYRGLFHFIRYIEKLRKYETDQGEAGIYSEQDDLVRIMSIHKSKGLQFPAVFVAGLGRRFNKTDLAQKILIDPALGISCDYVDVERRLRIPAMKRLAVKRRLEAEQLGEELRVLYVALSRAQEKLILTAFCSSVEALLKKYAGSGEAELNATQLTAAGNYLDWICMAQGEQLLQTTGGTLRLQQYSAAQLFSESAQALAEDMDRSLSVKQLLAETGELSPSAQALRERFGYCYPHAAACRLSPKHSVSEIKEAHIREYEGDPFVVAEEAAEVAVEAGMETSQSGSAASDGQKSVEQLTLSDGASRGNAYHRALAFYDYEKGTEQLSALLSEEEYAKISLTKFRQFVDSPLGTAFHAAQKAGNLYREQHFMKEVPYNYLFPESEVTEPVLLQGIIDAYILEADGIVLVDYKTDRVPDAETLRRRYAKQLDLYADALYNILKMPVKQKLLYSFHLGQSIAV